VDVHGQLREWIKVEIDRDSDIVGLADSRTTMFLDLVGLFDLLERDSVDKVGEEGFGVVGDTAVA
jgi:hypothetical protein